MTTGLVVAVVIVAVVVLFVPWIAGAIIARRASNRWQWSEANLAFLAFAATPLLTIANMVTLPIIGWARGQLTGSDQITIGLLQWTSTVFQALQAAALVLIAVALYRLAARVAQNRIDISSSAD